MKHENMGKPRDLQPSTPPVTTDVVWATAGLHGYGWALLEHAAGWLSSTMVGIAFQFDGALLVACCCESEATRGVDDQTKQENALVWRVNHRGSLCVVIPAAAGKWCSVLCRIALCEQAGWQAGITLGASSWHHLLLLC